MLNYSTKLTNESNLDDVIAWGRKYRAARDEGKDSATAGKIADKESEK